MAGLTTIASTNSGVFLFPAVYDSTGAVTIPVGGVVTAPGIAISNFLYVNLPAYTWTLVNQGQVIGGTASYGIALQGSASLTNGSPANTTALIAGDHGGALLTGALTNYGTMASTGTSGGIGARVLDATQIINGSGADPSALITGLYAAHTASGAVTIINFGTISERPGTSIGVDVSINGAGTVVNGSLLDTTAFIGGTGVVISGGAGTVTNFGTIGYGVPFGVHHGVTLKAGGWVTNGSLLTPKATIPSIMTSGAGATVINYGYIYGATVGQGGTLINGSESGTILDVSFPMFAPGTIPGIGNSTYGTIVNHGSLGNVVLNQGVLINGGVNNPAVISGAYHSVTQRGVYMRGSATVTNFGHIYQGVRFSGVDTNRTLTNAGTIESGFGTLGTAVSFGYGHNVLDIAPGSKIIGVVRSRIPLNTSFPGLVFTASNTLELSSGSSLGLPSASSGTLIGVGSQFTNFGTISFDSDARWSISGNAAGLASGQVILGFAPGDALEITGLTESVKSYANGTLTLAGDAELTLNIAGSFSTASFTATPVQGGTHIELACFAAGTLIRTDRGNIRIERLRVGDQVTTLQGDTLPIVRIHHRHVQCSKSLYPQRLWPVLIAADAFGTGQPFRNLLLSPAHAVYFENSLIPIRHLINGTTIRQVRMDHVSYYHIELPRHEVVLAEGLATESFLNRSHDSIAEHGSDQAALYADASSHAWESRGYAPLVVAGKHIETIRQMLSAVHGSADLVPSHR